MFKNVKKEDRFPVLVVTLVLLLIMVGCLSRCLLGPSAEAAEPSPPPMNKAEVIAACPVIITNPQADISSGVHKPISIRFLEGGKMVVAGRTGEVGVQEEEGWRYFDHPLRVYLDDMAVSGHDVWVAHRPWAHQPDLEREGVSRLNSAGEWEIFNFPNTGIPSLGHTAGVVATSDGTIFVTSSKDGAPVAKRSPDGEWKQYTVADEFPGDTRGAIVTTDGVVVINGYSWIAFVRLDHTDPTITVKVVHVEAHWYGITDLAEGPDGVWAVDPANIYHIKNGIVVDTVPLERWPLTKEMIMMDASLMDGVSGSSLAVDDLGRVWVGYYNGVDVYDRCRREWILHYQWDDIPDGGRITELKTTADGGMVAVEYWSGQVFSWRVTQSFQIYLPLIVKWQPVPSVTPTPTQYLPTPAPTPTR